MGEMRVMDRTGDTTIEWDPADKKATEDAKAAFNKLKKEGYDFFEVSETKGKQVKSFKKTAGKLIAAPGRAKTTPQRKAGKAMSGGPNAQRTGLGRLPRGFSRAEANLARKLV